MVPHKDHQWHNSSRWRVCRPVCFVGWDSLTPWVAVILRVRLCVFTKGRNNWLSLFSQGQPGSVGNLSCYWKWMSYHVWVARFTVPCVFPYQLLPWRQSPSSSFLFFDACISMLGFLLSSELRDAFYSPFRTSQTGILWKYCNNSNCFDSLLKKIPPPFFFFSFINF